MTRVTVFLALLLLAAPARGQDAPTPAKVYTAYYKVSYGDMAEWIQLYQERTVPILDALAEEGLINGHGAHIHHTGGEYNFRMAIRGDADIDYPSFWSAYLERLNAASASDFERANRLVQAHRDEIWGIQETNLSGQPARYFYDAHFQINFADLGEWNRQFDQALKPMLDASVEDGTLVGWVVEAHDTGGRYNWKVITLFNDWDRQDEFNDRLYETVPLDHPLWDLVVSHDDVLWESLPGPDGN